MDPNKPTIAIDELRAIAEICHALENGGNIVRMDEAAIIDSNGETLGHIVYEGSYVFRASV